MQNVPISRLSILGIMLSTRQNKWIWYVFNTLINQFNLKFVIYVHLYGIQTQKIFLIQIIIKYFLFFFVIHNSEC